MIEERISKSRIVIAAPKSGSGKTSVTLGLISALKKRGLSVSAFKCGPDYIDPLFHREILRVPSGNLDTFFTDHEKTREIFLSEATGDISVIEGVMGLYDTYQFIGNTGDERHSRHHKDAIISQDGLGFSRSYKT